MHRLTLSFDNGPFPDVTPGVLDVLAAFGVPATFFVCGKDVVAPERRAIVASARAAGHRVGNHTLTHTVELGTTDDAAIARREIGDAQEALGDLASPGRLFRPCGGGGVLGPRLLSRAAVRYLCEGGYTCVLWNSVPRDWEDPLGWPERALDDVLRQDWTVLVLHDVPTGAMAALPRFLEAALAAGAVIEADFPAGLLPIHAGRVTGSLDGIVGPPEARARRRADRGAA
jgi:peptidoglycan/xylan/chitin deacetylase (PgdA/CDA1 family)